jgi:uncharacterized protein (DUF1499 family)
MMKTIKRLLIVAVIAVVVWQACRFLIVQISPTPANLGVVNSALASCGNLENCINNYEGQVFDTGQAPVEKAYAHLIEQIENDPAAKIITQSEHYLHAEYTSKWMGYIDDLELYVNTDDGRLHIRSASRIGKKDFGVNRKRVEYLLKSL